MLFAYWPAVHFGYTAEDVPVTNAIHLSDLMTMPIPRQLSDLSLRLQVNDPHAMHVTSLAIHLLNGLLLAVLIGVGSWAGALAAMTWWLASIQSESVVYLSARADLLVVCFTLLALVVNRWSVWLALACCLLAVWAKETGVMAFALLALWRGWHRQSWRGVLLPLVGVGSIVAWYLLPRLYTWANPSVETAGWYAAIQLTAVWRLLALVIYPRGLTIDHDWDAITHGMALVACVGTMLALCVARRLRSVQFAALWVFLALLPRFLVPQGDWIAERHLPIALLGPWLALFSSGVRV